MTSIKDYCLDIAQRARVAGLELAATSGELKNRWLLLCADALVEHKESLIRENEKDLLAAKENGLTEAMIDRLRLTDKTLNEMGNALREIAAFSDPIGKIIDSTVRPNGLEIQKVRVPLGVIFFIYESRPNVTIDAAAICVKSGNAVILRGGSEAIHSNIALGKILSEAAVKVGLPRDAVILLDTTDRAAIDEFLRLPEYINVAIPRGGEALIRRVSENAKMPVIKHFAGNCHLYIDRDANLAIAEKVVVNSKCQRLGTCNTAESMIVHVDVATTILPKLCEALINQGVEIRGDTQVCSLIPAASRATEDDYYQEYLAAIISINIVDSIDEAITHINKHSSGHTEAIISQNIEAIRRFVTRIDSSAVMVNASTRLNDGGQFGLGAEIGISTDKFHARGPCGINELTIYKYVAWGDGHIRQ